MICDYSYIVGKHEMCNHPNQPLHDGKRYTCLYLCSSSNCPLYRDILERGVLNV